MKKDNLYKKMLNTAILPVLLFGFVITLFCYNRFTNTVYDEARDNMRTIARDLLIAYDIAYPGDFAIVSSSDDKFDFWKGNNNITYDYSIVDRFSLSSDTELSVMYMDMRVHTTFKTDLGKRLAGVFSNAETSHRVLEEKETVFYNDISILGDEYLVLYLPVTDSKDNVVGMIEVAKRTSELKHAVWHSVWPVLLLAIPGMIVAAYFSFKKTKEITDVLKKLQIFLNKVSSGNLSTELDTECLRRADELGEISRASLSMQKSIRGYVETDALTGLCNRRYVHYASEKLIDKSIETGLPFSVAITDIDFFKKVNDTYGHNAGDVVLKAVAGQLKTVMQGNGFAARWGGEEFVLIFDKVSAKDALPTLEILEERIREMVVRTEGNEISITMTMGISEGDTSKTFDEIVEAADELLYYGKEHGRNQIVYKME